jgi:tetratricopeptide (TPR) repeat protein
LNNIEKTCLEQFSAKKSPEQEKAISYGNLGWKAFEAGDVDKCIELSKKALSIDNTLGVVQANLGLCYLIKGEEDAATEYYLDALTNIKKEASTSVTLEYLQAVISDLKKALTRNPALKGGKFIMALFESEVKTYQSK